MSGNKKKFNSKAIFKPRTKNEDNAELSNTVIIMARKTGVLKLSSKGLSSVPDRIWTVNESTEEELKDLDFEFGSECKEERWWEQVPLKILDLSSNSVDEIDSKIKYLTELETLDLHHNLLKLVPSEIGELSKLKKLDLSLNNIEILPQELFNLIELQELCLKNNILKDLQTEIGDLVMLVHLDLSHNNLINLPIGLGYLVRLNTLNLSHNSLLELPPDLMSMRALKKLDACHNQLEELPCLIELRKVEVLMFHSNKIKTFPDISGCVALRELQLANNNIKNIETTYLETLRNLKILILANNQIETIPEEMINLMNLEILDFTYNNITLIPDFIGIMHNLKNFSIEGNDIKNIRTDILRCGTSRIIKHMRQNMDGTNLHTKDFISQNQDGNIYPTKYTMVTTKHFSLNGYNLTEIPDDLLQDLLNAEVTSIDLSGNKLQELPNIFSKLITVRDFKLTSNRMTILPSWIGDSYKNLQFLDLNKNHFQSLPPNLCSLEHLRHIDISFNRYVAIPECLYDIINLEVLIANDNRITKIDTSSLQKLSRLTILNLANNSIEYVPPELGNLTTLKSLILTGNCFKQPRQAILLKNTEEILAYLRDRITT